MKLWLMAPDETFADSIVEVAFEPSPEIQVPTANSPFGAPSALCSGPQSYKLDMVFTKVKSSTANDRELGVYCDKRRRLRARKNPHAGLSDPWRRYTRRPD